MQSYFYHISKKLVIFMTSSCEIEIDNSIVLPSLLVLIGLSIWDYFFRNLDWFSKFGLVPDISPKLQISVQKRKFPKTSQTSPKVKIVQNQKSSPHSDILRLPHVPLVVIPLLLDALVAGFGYLESLCSPLPFHIFCGCSNLS